MAGLMEVPGTENLGTQNGLEVGELCGGDGGVIDDSGGVDDVLDTARGGVNLCKRLLQRLLVADVDAAVHALALELLGQRSHLFLDLNIVS